MKRSTFVLVFMMCLYAYVFGSMSRLIRWKGKEVGIKAKIENITIGEKGFVSLAPGVDTLFKSSEVFLWDCVMDRKENLYVSSGNLGNVFRIDKNRQVFTVFTSDKGTEIYALAIDKQNNVFIGESPSGIIYRVSPNGKPKEFFSTGEKYIWDLIFDGSGMLFAATGDRGKLFRIHPDGKGEVYYGSNENHIMSIYLYKKKMYAGTEPSGLFVEIQGKNRVEVLYDAKGNEVHSIAGVGNRIFFSTISQPSVGPSVSYGSFFGISNVPSGTKKADGSLLYSYDIERKVVTPLWKCPTPPIYSISRFTDESILAGTDNGKLYSSDSEGNVKQINQFDVSPVLKIVEVKTGVQVVLTGNIGDVLRIGARFSHVGRITSDVFDTGRKSIFGKVDWNVDVPQGTSFSLFLRVGNKENPVDEWSDWKRMKKGGNIGLSPSRFVQIKCELATTSGSKSPTLKDVTVSYLPGNRGPSIKKLVVCPVGINAGGNTSGGFGTATPLTEKQKKYYTKLGFELPATVYSLDKGKRCAYWEASDPDGDSLSFTFSYKGNKEKEWKVLKKDILLKSFIWDETSLPDGIYSVKVTASDVINNPAARALNAELISEPFTVDNSAPEVNVESTKIKGRNIEINAKAKDKLSLIKSCCYSINGGKWKVVLPADGIYDSFNEDFHFTVKVKEKGEKTIVVKVTDFSLNVGAGKGMVNVR